MVTIRQTLLGGLGVFAILSVAGTPAASAAEFLLETGSSFPQTFNKTLIQLTEASLFHAEALGVGVAIECDHVELAKGELASDSDSTMEVKYLDCTVLEPSGCELTVEPLVINLLGAPLSATETEFKPDSGATFVVFELTGCVAAGKYEFTGSQICTIESGNLQTTHESQCDAAGSKLAFVSPKTTYSHQAIPLSLTSGAKFGQEQPGLGFLLESGRSFPQAFKSTLIELSDASLLKGMLGEEVKTEIECRHVELVSGELTSATISKAHIDYLGCVVLAPSGCGVAEPIEVKLTGEPVGASKTKFKPETGTAFAESELSACSVKGKYKVTGSQVCETENSSLQVLHEMECEESGNELKFGGNAAHYTSQPLPLELASGATFGQGAPTFSLETGKSFPQELISASIELEDGSRFHADALGMALTVECKRVELVKGEFASAANVIAEIKYSTCAALEPSGCTATEPIVTTLSGSPHSATETEFKPESGPTFATIELTGCAAAGKYELAGSQICTIENGSLQTTHKSECEVTGSELTFVASTGAYLTSRAMPLSLTSGATFGQGPPEFRLEAGKSFPQAFKSALIELSNASLLHGELLFVKTEIECKHVELASGELASATESRADIDYLGCTVEKPAGCSVTEPIEVHLSGTPTSATGTRFKPETGTTFVEIELTVCSLKGKYKVTGSQVCETENSSLQVLHEMTCEESGNELKFGGDAAHYTSQPLPLELASGATFGQD